MQEVIQNLGIRKTRTTRLHPQSGGMLERYVKIVEHLSDVSAHQRDWNERLAVFLLAYRTSISGLIQVARGTRCP